MSPVSKVHSVFFNRDLAPSVKDVTMRNRIAYDVLNNPEFLMSGVGISVRLSRIFEGSTVNSDGKLSFKLYMHTHISMPVYYSFFVG